MRPTVVPEAGQLAGRVRFRTILSPGVAASAHDPLGEERLDLGRAVAQLGEQWARVLADAGGRRQPTGTSGRMRSARTCTAAT